MIDFPSMNLSPDDKFSSSQLQRNGRIDIVNYLGLATTHIEVLLYQACLPYPSVLTDKEFGMYSQRQ